MKRLLVIIAGLVLASSMAGAQSYDWAAGLRAGIDGTGLTGKMNFGGGRTVEAMAVYGQYGYDRHSSRDGYYDDHVHPYNHITFAAFYEWNAPVIGDGFNLYYGLGGHVGGASSCDDSALIVGADLILGLEYSLPTFPLAISLDYRPFLDMVKLWRPCLRAYDIGIGVKYCF